MKRTATYLLLVLVGVFFTACLSACAPVSGENHQKTYDQFNSPPVGYQFEVPLG